MSKLLLTGGTGYIGFKLLGEVLQFTQYDVLLPVRASSPEKFQTRTNELSSKLSEQNKGRVHFINSDLSENLLNALEPSLSEIEIVVHNAAITAFNVDEQSANKINRDGSKLLFQLARSCKNLKKLLYVSTLYSTGLRNGPIKEQFYDSSFGFANHYERSKWEAEEILRTEYGALPWSIARIATVIADNNDGLVIQQNAIHNTLKLFYYGLISLLPGLTSTPVYLVEGDFIAKALLKIIANSNEKKIYHIAHEKNDSATLGGFIDQAYEVFSKYDDFKARRILKPLFADSQSFDSLVGSVQAFGSGILSQSVSSIAPFGKQLFITKEVSNTNTRELMGDYKAPIAQELIKNACSYLCDTRFVNKSRGAQ